MIRKPKAKSKAKKRNPSSIGASDLISTIITPKKKGVYEISILVGGKQLDSIERNFGTFDRAKIAADIAKEVVVKELKKFPKEKGAWESAGITSFQLKKKNPDEYRLRERTKNALDKSFALPETNVDAFELGVLVGTKNTLKNYCGAFDFLKRRAKLKAITKEISDGLDGLTRKIEIRGEGIETPIPVIRRVSSKS